MKVLHDLTQTLVLVFSGTGVVKVFHDLTRALVLAFSGTGVVKVFQNLLDSGGFWWILGSQSS